MVMQTFDIIPLGDAHREWATRLIAEHWGSRIVVTRGRAHDTSRHPGFVAVMGGKPVGLATCRIDGTECELMTLDSLAERRGIGTALVGAVMAAGRAAGCKRLWLITTNDNLRAVRFYQKLGFRLVAVHRDAMKRSRELKPEIPLAGIDGIPIRDEIELEIPL
jgi:ribosomal protein S18 acetylase RimI-like enzyme